MDDDAEEMVPKRIQSKEFVRQDIEEFPYRPVDSDLVLDEGGEDVIYAPYFSSLFNEVVVIPDEAVVEGVCVEQEDEDGDY